MNPNQHQTVLDCLNVAEEEVRRMLPLLNTRERPCNNCGLIVHEERDEWIAYNELLGVVNKLHKWKQFFEDNP